MIKCIAFDMDDTLYDERDYYISGFTTVAARIATDFRLPTEEIFHALCRIFDGGNRQNTFDTAASEMGIIFKEGYIENLVKIFREHTPDINLPPDSRAVLKDLKGRYKLGLITDGYLPAQRLKVKSLDIETYFDCIIYTEELGRENWKPSPAGFEKLTADLKIPPQQCVYVGDNLERDFSAPNKMGFKTIRIIRENRIHFGKAADSQASANYEIDSIAKLQDLLRKIDSV
jgi:putative hydrolase of the HAD superfamily